MHPTAIIHPEAVLGAEVQVGPFSIIERGVRIGARTRIEAHALIARGANIGEDCRILQGAVVSNPPQDLKYRNEPSDVTIGDRTIIREYCTIHRGTEHGGLHTTVGSDCLLMAYSHVAHDCHIGNCVIIANAVNMAGHVVIEDFASLGGVAVIHQFVRIGSYAFIGGLARVSQDVPPYVLATGNPMKYYGPNAIGLKRRGFTAEQILTIKRTYLYIYRSKLNLTQAVEAIKNDMEMTPEVAAILKFIDKSERGLIGRNVKE